MHILIASGVNLDLLGTREPHLYGHQTLADIAGEVEALPAAAGITIEWFQSNDEAAFLERLSSSPWDGAVINPGAWTHTSLALGDRLAALGRPYIELHVTNPAARESFRHHSYIAAHALGTIAGFGARGYGLAVEAMVAHLQIHACKR